MGNIGNQQERSDLVMELEREADHLNESVGETIAKYDEMGVELTIVEKERLRSAVKYVYNAIDQLTIDEIPPRRDYLVEAEDKATVYMQDEIAEELLTLWERMCTYAGTTSRTMTGIHPRVFEALVALEHALLEHRIIADELIAIDW